MKRSTTAWELILQKMDMDAGKMGQDGMIIADVFAVFLLLSGRFKLKFELH